MNLRNGLIAAGIAAFLVCLIAFAPASVAVGLLAPRGSSFTAVTGTVWQGSAAAAQVGRLRLGATSWSLSPLALFTGRLAGDVATRIGEGDLHGTLSLGLSGRLACRGCRYEGPAASLRDLFPALRSLGGALVLDLAALELHDRWPVKAVGSAQLSRIPIAVPGMPVVPGTAAGDFEASFSADPVPEDGILVVDVKDAGGPLQLTGSLKLRPPGSYEFAGHARARANAPVELVNALSVLGPRGPDGSTEIAASGTF